MIGEVNWPLPNRYRETPADASRPPPLLVRDLAGAVTLERPDAHSLKVMPLDFNGYPLPGVMGDAATIPLRRDVAYCSIEP